MHWMASILIRCTQKRVKYSFIPKKIDSGSSIITTTKTTSKQQHTAINRCCRLRINRSIPYSAQYKAQHTKNQLPHQQRSTFIEAFVIKIICIAAELCHENTDRQRRRRKKNKQTRRRRNRCRFSWLCVCVCSIFFRLFHSYSKQQKNNNHNRELTQKPARTTAYQFKGHFKWRSHCSAHAKSMLKAKLLYQTLYLFGCTIPARSWNWLRNQILQK